MRESIVLPRVIDSGTQVFYPKIIIRDSNGTDITYDSKIINSIKVSKTAFSGETPSVGCCPSATATISLNLNELFGSKSYTDEAILEKIPKNARIIIQAYYKGTYDGSVHSDYFTLGYFYVDTRVIDEHSGNIELSCYDLMLRAEELYLNAIPTEESGFPMSDITVLQNIASRLGVTLTSATVSAINKNYQIGYPNDFTMRELLGFIGGAYGGNFVISDDNLLKFLPMKPESYTSVASFTATEYKTSNDLLAYDGVEISAGTMTVETPSEEDGSSKNETVNVVYYSGAENGMNTLKAYCPWATQEMADDLYGKIQGYVYHPFNAQKSVITDCIGIWELGDVVSISNGIANDNSCVIYNMEVTIGTLFPHNISAPYTEQSESESYKASSKQEREIRRVVADATQKIGSSFRVDFDQITASVATNQDISDLRNDFENQNTENEKQFNQLTEAVNASMTSEAVNIAINSALSNGVNKVETETGYTFDSTGLHVTKSNNELETTITEDGMKVTESGNTVLLANSNGCYARNLEATTYLIIGKTSRFEDVDGRTCCFWIGN